MTVMFERPVQVIVCQCIVPCFQPYRVSDDEWSDAGCLREHGHDGDHGPDGPGAVTFRDPPERTGPRVVLQSISAHVWSGTCTRCQSVYHMAVTQMLQ